MFPLDEFPLSITLQILQKMELRTWVQSRLTGPFIFNLVQENAKNFNYACPLVKLTMQFGNYPFKFIMYLTDEFFLPRQIEVVINDPKVSLAGLSFNEITFIEYDKQYEDQTCEDYQAYIQERNDILHNFVLPAAAIVKNRVKCAVLNVRHEEIGNIVEAVGCSKLFTRNAELRYKEYPTWIDQPQLLALERLKLSSVVDFCHAAQFIRRFKYFYANTVSKLTEVSNCQEEVRDILKELATGSPLPGPRSVTLKRDYYLAYQDGTEFEAVNHRILLKRKIKHSFFSRFNTDTSNFIVALIEEKNFIGIVTIIYADQANGTISYPVHYRMELFPSFDPQRTAIFLMQRAVALRPIDISELYEDLKKGEDIGDSIQAFLALCHSNI